MGRPIAGFVLIALLIVASVGATRAAPDSNDPSVRDQNPAYAISDLGTLGGDISVATAISESGLVVGWSTTAPGQEADGPGVHAFLW